MNARAEEAQEVAAVAGVGVEGLAANAAVHDVVNSAGVFNA
jgi:hypothetical protein